MDFNTSIVALNKQKVDCIVVATYGCELFGAAAALDRICDKAISNVLKHGDLVEKRGSTLLLHDLPNITASRVLLVDCGDGGETSKMHFREICASVASKLRQSQFNSICVSLHEISVAGANPHWKISQLCTAVSEAHYQFDFHKSEKAIAPSLKSMIIHAKTKKQASTFKKYIAEVSATAHGMSFAKDLGNMAANYCTPTYLAEQAIKLAKKFKSLRAEILSEADMKKLGMGSLLSVSQGTKEPPKLIILHYDGGRKTQKPIVLVGKGVTFDTGGVSLKPRDSMDEMKYDMCGAAAVMGTMQAIAELGVKTNLICVVAAVENHIAYEATKPGDIVTSMSGQTIEILNTDAEGRLILCDALTYVERYNPQCVLDVATLTGMMLFFIGNEATGVFTKDKALADQIMKAGETTYDRAWAMPLWDEYHKLLKSNFADVANIGGKLAGSITAACFLERFTKAYRWAHLDIAGVAWHSGAKKGSTGRPVPLLVEFVLQAGARK